MRLIFEVFELKDYVVLVGGLTCIIAWLLTFMVGNKNHVGVALGTLLIFAGIYVGTNAILTLL